MTDDEKDWRHLAHYYFAHKVLPQFIFREFAEHGVAFLKSPSIQQWMNNPKRDDSRTLSELWDINVIGMYPEEDFPRKDFFAHDTDFSATFRFDEIGDWAMFVITPPPALKAPEAQQIGFFFSLLRYGSIEKQLVEETNEFEERGLPFDIDHPMWVNCYLRYICLEKATPVGGIELSGFHIGEWMSDGSRDNLGSADEATVEETFNVMEYLIAQDNRFKR
jgi:hypothetical protein